jgi:hypothetical protein
MGLFAIASIKKGDIIGIYENYSGGKRLTSARIKRPSHRSAYAVEHNGLVRDAWNPDLNKPCCKLAYSNDSMDPNKDNATLGVNPNFPMSLLFIATQDIEADPANPLPIYLPYGGKYWCDDLYPVELQEQAIRRYSINIYTSTEDIDGDWAALRNFPQLSQLFPPSHYDAIPNPTEAAPPTVTLALPVTTTISDKKRSNPSPRIIKDARQRTIGAYIMNRTLEQDPHEGVSNSQSNQDVHFTTTIALSPSTSTAHTEIQASHATLVIPASDKKRSPPTSSIIKVARQRTLDSYITRRTLAKDTPEGVSNRICYDVSACDVLTAALNSNHLYIENLKSPLPTVNSSSIANSTTISHSRDENLSPKLDHDKRDVFI